MVRGTRDPGVFSAEFAIEVIDLQRRATKNSHPPTAQFICILLMCKLFFLYE